MFRKSTGKIKDNGFKLTKERGRSYPAQIITNVEHADDIALLANTPAQAKSLLHCLERETASIGLYVNADKTKYMQSNQRDDISTLNWSSLKLLDYFTYQGSSVSSSEKDINTWLAKVWTAIDKLSVIWKSDLTDKIKRCLFQQYWTWPGGRTQQSSSCTATYDLSRKLSKLDEHDMWDTAGEVGTNT